MKKDKSWLLEKHRECAQSPKTGEKMLDEGYELALNDILIYINQLDGHVCLCKNCEQEEEENE